MQYDHNSKPPQHITAAELFRSLFFFFSFVLLHNYYTSRLCIFHGEDDMSGEFECVCGNVYGEKYRKVYTAIQIRATDAIALESELQKKGIQTSSAAPGRVNIRVK